MIFRKKRSPHDPVAGPRRSPGRDGAEAVRRTPGVVGQNPLARRLQPESEPDTVELEQRDAAMPSTGGTAEPGTRSYAFEAGTHGEEEAAASNGPDRLVSYAPATGKYYVHPLGDDTAVELAGETVRSQTELRNGDRIRIGDAELEFSLGQRQEPS